MSCRTQGLGADNEECAYQVGYMDGTNSIGYIGVDLHLRWWTPDFRRQVSLQYVGFGCGHTNHLNINSGVSGIFGLANQGNGVSVLEQFQRAVGSSFQLCFPIAGRRTDGFIQIGDQNLPVAGRNGFSSTPFLNKGMPGLYFVDVVDFHVNGVSVGIPPGTFNFFGANDLLGGFNIDSGSFFLILITGAFYHVRDAYRNAMRPQLGNTIITGRSGMDTCWDVSGKNMPNINAAQYGPIFRLGRAMVLRRIATFFTYISHKGNPMWCLPVLQHTEMSIFGGYASQ
ncbi:hypothetical protein Mapa_003101 [Marchantia paleacea]|nr:hypothetical protein Mapa_003101 [Marchantia paleacea]